jgi:hypothetical protein
MKWTKEEKDISIYLIKMGNTYDEIAVKLNRTRKSVKEKLNKLGYTFLVNSDIRYYESKKCVNCEKEFNDLKSNNRKFCSQSCSATYNNLYDKTNKKTLLELSKEKYNERKRLLYNNRKSKKCLSCEKITTNKFCNQTCQSLYRKKVIFEKIESGDITLNSCQYKKYLIDKYGEKCMECGWLTIHPITNKVPIELEHIDGNSENNSLVNLKLLCPNCHSLTPTYKALNIGNGRHKRMERYKEAKSY